MRRLSSTCTAIHWLGVKPCPGRGSSSSTPELDEELLHLAVRPAVREADHRDRERERDKEQGLDLRLKRGERREGVAEDRRERGQDHHRHPDDHHDDDADGVHEPWPGPLLEIGKLGPECGPDADLLGVYRDGDDEVLGGDQRGRPRERRHDDEDRDGRDNREEQRNEDLRSEHLVGGQRQRIEEAGRPLLLPEANRRYNQTKEASYEPDRELVDHRRDLRRPGGAATEGGIERYLEEEDYGEDERD